jgi:hypothetical protein
MWPELGAEKQNTEQGSFGVKLTCHAHNSIVPFIPLWIVYNENPNSNVWRIIYAFGVWR